MFFLSLLSEEAKNKRRRAIKKCKGADIYYKKEKTQRILRSLTAAYIKGKKGYKFCKIKNLFY